MRFHFLHRLFTFSAFLFNTYLLTYLLTYSMVQSPSWEANWFAASQEIPRVSRNQKVHYRTHKRQPSVSILGQPNPVHIPTPHLLEIHPNIIHPSPPRSPRWSPSLLFPHHDPIPPPLLTHTRHMPSSGFFFLSPEQTSRMWEFLNKVFLQGGVVSTSPNPQAGGPPLVGCPRLLIQFIRSYPPIGGRSYIRNPRTRHAVVTGTHFTGCW